MKRGLNSHQARVRPTTGTTSDVCLVSKESNRPFYCVTAMLSWRQMPLIITAMQ